MSDETNQLIPASGAGTGPSNDSRGVTAFQQQGQIDWTSLSKTSVSFTVGVLSRMSKAGVEAMTLAIAYEIFRPLKLSVWAQDQVSASVAKLGAFSSFNTLLSFGFGIKHIVREMADSVEGLSCLSFCAALTEAYNPGTGARILREMFSLLNPPADLEPSTRQWKHLLEACEGALAHTHFSEAYHQMIKLCVQHGEGVVSAAPADAVARAILALSQVTSGQISSITVVGGADCVWLAAVGYWLLNLEVEIHDGAGTVLYKSPRWSPGGHGLPQRDNAKPRGKIIVFYNKVEDGENSGKDLTVSNRVYHIPNGKSIINLDWTIMDENVLSYGRVGWDTILEDMFGPDANLLFDTGSDIGRRGCLQIGLYARLYELLATEWPLNTKTNGVQDIYSIWRVDSPQLLCLNPVSYGRGLIDTINNWLPEIRNHKSYRAAIYEAYEKACDFSTEQVVEDLSILLKEFASCCTCVDCDTFSQKWQLNPRYRENEASNKKKTRYCVFTVAAMVHRLALLLSHLHFPTLDKIKTLLPSRSGLQLFYSQTKGEVDSLRKLPYMRGTEKDFCARLVPDSSFFAQAILIFGSNIPSNSRVSIHVGTPKRWVAYTQGGVCFVLNILIHPRGDWNQAGLICIAPGKIEWQGWTYGLVADNHKDLTKGAPDLQIPASVKESKKVPTDLPADIELISGAYSRLKLELEVTDTLANADHALSVDYKLTACQGAENVVYRQSPGTILRYILEGSGGPLCIGRNCEPALGSQSHNPSALDRYFLVNGLGRIQRPGPLNQSAATEDLKEERHYYFQVVPHSPSPLSAWMALMVWLESRIDINHLSRKNQCLLPIPINADHDPQPCRIQTGSCVSCLKRIVEAEFDSTQVDEDTNFGASGWQENTAGEGFEVGDDATFDPVETLHERRDVIPIEGDSTEYIAQAQPLNRDAAEVDIDTDPDLAGAEDEINELGTEEPEEPEITVKAGLIILRL